MGRGGVCGWGAVFCVLPWLIQSARARVNQTCDVKERPASFVSAQSIIIVRGVLRGKCDISVGCS